ncbi:midcut-by-XrtH protein [Ottowia thiooxydans]|uniref:Midcut-by-XrtH protein n=1 Tax=Ottowia thiooxydans TaxID=219182 RepID=A0ABV2Q760_9BURK
MTQFIRPVYRIGAIGVITSLCSVTSWAQSLMCSVAIDHISAAPPTPAAVPSLSDLALAALIAGVAVMAWRQRKLPGARPLAAALLTAAAFMANQGGGGLIQKAYAATADIVSPSGTLNLQVPNSEQLTLTNRSGVPVRITGVVPEWIGCAAGTLLEPNGSCTTTPISCGGGGGNN